MQYDIKEFSLFCHCVSPEISVSERERERQATNYANPLEWLMLHEFISNKVNERNE